MEEHTTTSDNNTQGQEQQERRRQRQQLDVVQTSPPSETASILSYPSQRPSKRRATESLDHDPGRSDNQFPVFHKETSWCRVFAPCFVVQACPVKDPGHRVPLLDPGIHTASGARLRDEGGRLVRFTLPEGRTIRVIFHACDVQKPFSLLVVSLSRKYWSDLRADTDTLFFPDRVRIQHSQIQLHEKESFFYVRGC